MGRKKSMTTKKILALIITFSFIVIFVLTTGCGMSNTENQKGCDLVSKQKDYFADQAILQYGQDARVKNVRAETRTIYHPLFGIPSEKKITGDLSGDITVGKETFRGVYSSETGEIYSDKNYENIVESVKTFFHIPSSSILDVTLTDSAYEVYYLPDEINTFKGMLDNQYFMLVHIYTTEDLRRFTKEDFSAFYRLYDKYDEDAGYVVFVQLKDDADLGALQRDINSITFEYEDSHGKVYDNESYGYVDAFEKYQIEGALYLDKTKFIYNH